jgi:hypothetical protein
MADLLVRNRRTDAIRREEMQPLVTKPERVSYGIVTFNSDPLYATVLSALAAGPSPTP